MGRDTFSNDNYHAARRSLGVTSDRNITKAAEEKARTTGVLNPIVDPAINPMRYSKIRLDAHQGRWYATVGMPMDIEVSCDTTGSMGGEVDTEMRVLPDLYAAIAKVLPGYDPQLCLGIFGDCEDNFVMCRPQFEMRAEKIVEYLKEMAPQRGGGGNGGEDPQYAMFARAYLTDAYTNRVGLKGYHFIVTDEPYHDSLRRDQIERIFGENIFKDELKELNDIPSVKTMVAELKKKTHQFILAFEGRYSTVSSWRNLCGDKSVIIIRSTEQLPAIVSAIIGLTEGTLDVTDLAEHLGEHANARLISQLSNIEIGAQAVLRGNLPHPVPKAGDIYISKNDTWPIQPEEDSDVTIPVKSTEDVVYL